MPGGKLAIDGYITGKGLHLQELRMRLLVALLMLGICLPLHVLAQTQQELEAHRRDYIVSLTKAANEGEANAQVTLGLIYQMGIGVARDDLQAAGWHRKAAEQGNARAMSQLGFMYADGLGVPRNEEEALAWFRKSSQTEMQEYAKQPPKVPFAGDEQRAIAAARSGNSMVQVMVGKMYLAGAGIPQDDAKAARWLTEGAKGWAASYAHSALALMYDEGRGGLPKDRREAIRLYRKAAEQTAAIVRGSDWYSLLTKAPTRPLDGQDITTMDTFKGVSIWMGYKRDGTYELSRDLLYGKVFDLSRDEYELFPPWAESSTARGKRISVWNPITNESVDLVAPSIEAYNADPAKWAAIKGVVPKGTRLRMASVIYIQTIDIHDFHYIGVFLDGPFAGKPVLLDPISIGGLSVPKHYNVEYLKPVTAP